MYRLTSTLTPFGCIGLPGPRGRSGGGAPRAGHRRGRTAVYAASAASAWLPERDDPLLSALAEDADGPALEVHVRLTEADELDRRCPCCRRAPGWPHRARRPGWSGPADPSIAWLLLHPVTGEVAGRPGRGRQRDRCSRTPDLSSADTGRTSAGMRLRRRSGDRPASSSSPGTAARAWVHEREVQARPSPSRRRKSSNWLRSRRCAEIVRGSNSALREHFKNACRCASITG